MASPLCKAALVKVVKSVQGFMSYIGSHTLIHCGGLYPHAVDPAHRRVALNEVTLGGRAPSPGCRAGSASRGLGLFPPVLPLPRSVDRLC